jgi:hypothetical protein
VVSDQADGSMPNTVASSQRAATIPAAPTTTSIAA